MTAQKPDYLRPALTVGAAAGLLSGLPFLSAGNCFCCLWILGGAIVAVRLLANQAPGPLVSSDGAVVGALTGIVAAVVDALVSIPLRSFNLGLAPRLLDKAAEMGGQLPAGLDEFFNAGTGPLSPGWFLLGLMVSAAVFAVVGALGGLIGVSLLAKRAVPPAAPAPPADPPQTPPGPGDAA